VKVEKEIADNLSAISFNQKLINLIYYIIYNSAILITGVIDVS